MSRVRRLVLAAVLSAATLCPAAASTVDRVATGMERTVAKPRPAPRGVMGPMLASHAPLRQAAAFGPRLPMALAIRRELTVDVSRAVAEFYASRAYRPVWSEVGAAKVRARLAEAARDGLDPTAYRVPAGLTPAQDEVALTEAVLAYARHAHSGRVAPFTVSLIMTVEPPQLDARRFLARLARAGDDPVRAMESAHPQHEGYDALRQALGEALEQTVVDVPIVGRGPNLREGRQSPRVARLRARLAGLGHGGTVRRGFDPTRFDAALAEAVKRFQASAGLRPDGIVGPRTLTALDGTVEGDPVPALISNLERWRWLPRDLGDRHVAVNIPAYRVRVMHGEATRYEGRVIVGKPYHPTPVFSDVIEHVVVNPYWNVPYSIAKNEMLGGIQANPGGYFARRGYQAVLNGRVVDPSSITWNASTLRRVRVRQRPGRGNALGSVKFLFPNQHAVYLHDTPTKHLFSRAARAYSHGCVRVDQPFVFAEALLEGEADLSGPGLRRMVGGGERWLNLGETVPVHLTYFTREVAADGTLRRYADVYGFDRRLQNALGL